VKKHSCYFQQCFLRLRISKIWKLFSGREDHQVFGAVDLLIFDDIFKGEFKDKFSAADENHLP
jgi:hypothetical protein